MSRAFLLEFKVSDKQCNFTCSIQVLEKDLSIFGFFIALGRSTQSFIISNGYSVSDYTMESIIR